MWASPDQQHRLTTPWRAAACILLGSLVLASSAQPPAHASGRPHRMLATWLPYWDGDTGLNDVLAHRRMFRYVSPFWYATDTPKTFTPKPGAGNESWVSALQAQGIKVVPSITSAWGPRKAADVFLTRKRRHNHILAIESLVTSHGYDGVDLDYESMALSGTPAQAERVRAGYDTFVARLCKRLRAIHKQCDVTVMSKTKDSDRIAYDYAALGRAASHLRLMVYDMHGPWGSPGPVASTEWTNDVVRYATSLVRPRKIELAAPMYGYDWGRSGAHSVQWDDARALRRAHHSRLRYVGGEPTFTYRRHGVRHHVFYENAHSLRAKIRIAQRYRVGTLGFWYVGHESPRDWPLLHAYAVAGR